MPNNGKLLFVFRRDLRLEDNTALNRALESGAEVIPAFIFDPRQVKPHQYRSEPGLRFLLAALKEIDHELKQLGSKLYIFHGEPQNIVRELISKEEVRLIYFNRDYTPFSRERDKLLNEAALAAGACAKQFADSLLIEPEQALKDDGTPYTVFTPFYKRNSAKEVKLPTQLSKGRFYSGKIIGSISQPFEWFKAEYGFDAYDINPRSGALKILKNISQFSSYKSTRDLPAVENGTTKLSAHNKFGTVSIREVYKACHDALGKGCELIRELYWRDFFTHIGFNFPHVFNGAFHKIYDKLEWDEDPDKFSAWCEGRTGFPIVDAGMRELNQTGWMHNRVRMIVASFLTKDLHISWRWGERYFAQKLTDYDPAVNNGSWQWAASTGCDAQPYFRIFNPWLQQEKFDPECTYIHRFIPELKMLKQKQIHKLYESEELALSKYPRPIVDHAHEKGYAEEMFKKVRENSNKVPPENSP